MTKATKTTTPETAAEATTTTEGAAQETAAEAAAATETDISKQQDSDPEEKRIAIALWSIEHDGKSYGCGAEIALTEAEFDSLSKGGVLGNVIWKDLGLTD